MLDKIRLTRRWRIFGFIGISTLLVFTGFYTGFALDIGVAVLTRLPVMGYGGAPIDHYGPLSFEERIVGADVIARVKFLSVSSGVELHHVAEDETYYVSALEFRFEVLEYMKGGGGSELVAVAYDGDAWFQTRLGAIMLREDFLDSRDTRWDDREAIVFLVDNHDALPSSQQPDRYWMGMIRFDGRDYYTVSSSRSQAWLPVSSEDTNDAELGSGEQRFHTNDPNKSREPTTITLAELKTRIEEIDRELSAGDGSEEYRQCLYYKYELQRRLDYQERRGRPYVRNPNLPGAEHDLNSSLPADSIVFAHYFAGVREANEDSPDDFAPTGLEFWLEDEDKHLFSVKYPGVVYTERPLPQGEYKISYHEFPTRYLICDAYPKEYRNKKVRSVAVHAPKGTLHEAFFDPVDIDSTAVGAGSGNGVLKPASFDAPGSRETTVERLQWDTGSVEMELAPHSRLADHHIDFIALDGKVSLRLDFDDATEVDEDGTRALSWGVCEQPWSDGDLLMLRIGAGIPADGIAATNEPECQPSLPDQIFVPTAVPTSEPTPERTATPEPTAEPTPKPEPTVTPEPAVTRETEPTVTATTTPERASERTATSEPTATPSP